MGGSHGFLTILSAEDPTEAYLSAVTASTWASYNSVYHVGKALYAETRYGTVQTGMLCTSQEGGSARLIDAILKEMEMGIVPHCPASAIQTTRFLDGYQG